MIRVPHVREANVGTMNRTRFSDPVLCRQSPLVHRSSLVYCPESFLRPESVHCAKTADRNSSPRGGDLAQGRCFRLFLHVCRRSCLPTSLGSREHSGLSRTCHKHRGYADSPTFFVFTCDLRGRRKLHRRKRKDCRRFHRGKRSRMWILVHDGRSVYRLHLHRKERIAYGPLLRHSICSGR